MLRFDYRGTGDSFGELGEVTVSDWLEDIALAVREGREISGSRGCGCWECGLAHCWPASR